MSVKTKNILIVCATVLLCGLAFAWLGPLDKGTVAVSTGMTDYRITIEKTVVDCALDPCLLKYQTGIQRVYIFKENYLDENQSVTIERFKTTPVTVQLKKINKLVALDSIPDFVQSHPKPAIPDTLNFDPRVTPQWSDDGSALLYLEKETGNLKILESGNSKTISTLKNPSDGLSIKWGGKEKALIYGNGICYWISIKEGSRIKIPLAFTAVAALWTPEKAAVYLNDSAGSLYRLSPEKIETSPARADLNSSVWMDSERLLTLTQENFGSNLDILSPVTGDRKTLLSQSDLKSSEIQYDPTAKKVYIKNETDGKWYEMEF